MEAKLSGQTTSDAGREVPSDFVKTTLGSPVTHEMTAEGQSTEWMNAAESKYIDPSIPPESGMPEPSSLSLLVQTCDRIGRELGFGEFSKTLRSMVNDSPKTKPTYLSGPIRRLPTDVVGGTTDMPNSRQQRWQQQRSGQKRFRPAVMQGAISEWRSKVRRLQEINQRGLGAESFQGSPLLHALHQQRAETDGRLFNAPEATEEEPVNLSKSSSLCASPSTNDATNSANSASANSKLFSPRSTPTAPSSPQWDFDHWLRLFLLPPDYSTKLASQAQHCRSTTTTRASGSPCKNSGTSEQAPDRSRSEAAAHHHHPQALSSALLTQLLFLGSLLPCLLRGGTGGSAIQLADGEPAHRPTNALSR